MNPHRARTILPPAYVATAPAAFLGLATPELRGSDVDSTATVRPVRK